MTLLAKWRDWLRARLVDHAGQWWRMWSIRFAAIASFAVGAVLASPGILLETMNQLPPELRAVFPPATGIILFAFVTLVRLWKQGGRHDG